MPKKVSIILRTHSGADVHPGRRALAVSKPELIAGCLKSLVCSIAQVDRIRFAIRLSVIDDHSEVSCVNEIRQILDRAPFQTEFLPLVDTGVGAALKASFELARDNPSDLIYFVEDDYLHAPSALAEMLEAQDFFSQKLGGTEVAIFPVDYPSNYDPRIIRPSYLVLGPKRHWHTDFSTTGTFFISKKAYLANIEHCMRLTQYKIDPLIDEGNTINRIWTDGGVRLFSPVPTLAIHMQDEESMPRYIDWREWWNQYSRPNLS